MLKKVSVESAAEAYLELLASRGVEYFFGNAGTDFAPLIEAYAKRAAQGQVLPRPLTIPHEITAVGMAHGYAMVTGRPQIVMVHVVVGTANALGGIINAARSHAPILVTAGRTPITESGLPGIAQPAHPLGAGVVRSGRDGARVREVGLRAAHGLAGRDGRGSRAGHRAQRAAGAGLPHAAPRGAGRAPGPDRVLRSAARHADGERGGRTKDIERAVRHAGWRAQSDRHHQVVRARPRRGGRRWWRWPRRWPCRSSTRTAPT